MTTIAVFGGTGYAGGHVAREAVRRGHRVTSFSRRLPATPEPGVEYREGSIFDASVIAEASASDVIVIAVPPLARTTRPLSKVIPEVVEICVAGGSRLAYIGGAGSSLVADGGPRVVDAPDFPEDWKPDALAHAAILEDLRGSDPRLDWFVISPPALFGSYAPGEALGTYRTDGDVLVTKDDGSSEISGEDFALALVDEIEQRNHVRERFTVGH